jgi:hypothetical protein
LLQACAPWGCVSAPLLGTKAAIAVTPADCGCAEPVARPDSNVGLLREKKAEQLPPRPNVVLMISDDVDREWLGSYRSDGLSVTPHLDRLAKAGGRFTNAYAAASTCAPSRSHLWTHTSKTGIDLGHACTLCRGHMRGRVGMSLFGCRRRRHLLHRRGGGWVEGAIGARHARRGASS